MKRFWGLVILVLAVSQVWAQGAYTRAYSFDKSVANGTKQYGVGVTIGNTDSLNFLPGGETGKFEPTGDWLWLQNCSIVDSIGNSASIEWWLFNQRPTLTTDSTVWTPSYADLKKCIAVIPLGVTYYKGLYNSWDDEPNINRMLISPTKGYFWYVLVNRTASKTWSVASTLRLRPLFLR